MAEQLLFEPIGLAVDNIIIGCSGLAGIYNAISEEESIRGHSGQLLLLS
jgi:hypothetical protein